MKILSKITSEFNLIVWTSQGKALNKDLRFFETADYLLDNLLDQTLSYKTPKQLTLFKGKHFGQDLFLVFTPQLDSSCEDFLRKLKRGPGSVALIQETQDQKGKLSGLEFQDFSSLL